MKSKIASVRVVEKYPNFQKANERGCKLQRVGSFFHPTNSGGHSSSGCKYHYERDREKGDARINWNCFSPPPPHTHTKAPKLRYINKYTNSHLLEIACLIAPASHMWPRSKRWLASPAARWHVCNTRSTEHAHNHTSSAACSAMLTGGKCALVYNT